MMSSADTSKYESKMNILNINLPHTAIQYANFYMIFSRYLPKHITY